MTTYTKINRLINLEEGDSNSHRYGKINDISTEQIETFNAFIRNNYKTNIIQFESGYGESQIKSEFAVGLLFYSVETSCFYALGENITSKRIESRRIDRIRNIETLKEKNYCFQSNKFYKIYEEIFSSSYEQNVSHVKVLVQDFGNIINRFNDLCKSRKCATLRPIESPPPACIYTHVYEDDIRGLSDFSRYLRTFGMSVLAVSPPELKEKMINTYIKTIERYEEIYGCQNKT